ncbi:Rieske (2Fe-2S) protein [Streptomyces sp. SPB074]|uniref:Rieske (2Fe-2S) protein n=1 Tax=Streptomyces sp. (strain SPB074) TaxID=465543 RepID=UPI00056722FC|nr:Rieske (2Fe-2S) protein [Streptomyces sp. SPB074]
MTLLHPSGSGASRRAFVAAAGASGLAALLAACGGSSGGSKAKDSSGTSGGGHGTTLGSTADVPEGGGKIFSDAKVVVTQPSKGEFKAFTSVCTHAGCQVAGVSGGTINCACHGSKFSIEDGSVKHPPATSPLEELELKVTGDTIKLA